jgi:hypothetical protein
MPRAPIGTGLLALALSLLGASAAVAQRTPADTLAANSGREIQELVLRWVLAHHQTNLATPAAYCVAFLDGDPAAVPSAPVQPTDPSASFLSRFAEQGVPVRPNSECEQIRDPLHSILHVPSGRRPALQFTLGTVAWTADGVASIGVSYRQGGRWGKAWRCTARQDAGQWVLSGCETTWIA